MKFKRGDKVFIDDPTHPWTGTRGEIIGMSTANDYYYVKRDRVGCRGIKGEYMRHLNAIERLAAVAPKLPKSEWVK